MKLLRFQTHSEKPGHGILEGNSIFPLVGMTITDALSSLRKGGNDIENWDYKSVCRLLDFGKGVKVNRISDFEEHLDLALSDNNRVYVIDAVVAESSQGMRRLTGEIGRRLQNN